ncbi:hypothetical protein [Streptomyces roseoverticillatus]|uniref:hypothetical protein n=1 Tax=Streptomyces roseoverticillatus TaxID=66429 RepID=UPI003F577B8B
MPQAQHLRRRRDLIAFQQRGQREAAALTAGEGTEGPPVRQCAEAEPAKRDRGAPVGVPHLVLLGVFEVAGVGVEQFRVAGGALADQPDAVAGRGGEADSVEDPAGAEGADDVVGEQGGAMHGVPSNVVASGPAGCGTSGAGGTSAAHACGAPIMAFTFNVSVAGRISPAMHFGRLQLPELLGATRPVQPAPAVEHKAP